MPSYVRNSTRYISKLSNKLRRRMDKLAAGEELTGTQGRALRFILAAESDLCQKDLEEEYSIRPSSATELLTQLEKKGFITREENPEDKREKLIIPTGKALENQNHILGGLTELDAELTKGVSKEDLETFLNVLETMLDNLK